jgi:hypothetical protein
MFRMVTSAVPQGVELNLAKHVPLAPAYRPDIHGLRAIAVVAVVFFHAGIPGFGGGYVGRRILPALLVTLSGCGRRGYCDPPAIGPVCVAA